VLYYNFAMTMHSSIVIDLIHCRLKCVKKGIKSSLRLDQCNHRQGFTTSLDVAMFYNKSETQTRPKLSWGEAIWGLTNQLTDQTTDRPTNGRTRSLIEALCSHLEIKSCCFIQLYILNLL
jgi:hypothetical protein